VLSRCHHLRVLHLPLQPELLSLLLPYLASLPAFLSLELSTSVRKLALPAEMVTLAATSPSWASVHIRVANQQQRDLAALPVVLGALTLPAPEDADQVPRAFLRRFLVIRHTETAAASLEVASMHLDEESGKISWQLV